MTIQSRRFVDGKPVGVPEPVEGLGWKPAAALVVEDDHEDEVETEAEETVQEAAESMPEPDGGAIGSLADLRRFLLSQFPRIAAGQIDSAQVRDMCSLATVARNIAETELSAARLLKDLGGHAQGNVQALIQDSTR